MGFKDGDLVYAKDLDGFDLRKSCVGDEISPVKMQPERPIGIYRALYKNGFEVQSWIEPIEQDEIITLPIK